MHNYLKCGVLIAVVLTLYGAQAATPDAKDVKAAAAPTAPAAPAQRAAPSSTPNFCDQSFTAVTETADHDQVGYTAGTISAVPWVDVQDNHAKQVKMLSELSKRQNKGGQYTMTVSETQTCDGGPTLRIADGSFYAEGITLAGSVEVADIGIAIAKEINDRYRQRATVGAATGWNHKNAKKMERDSVTGQIIPPGQAKKQ